MKKWALITGAANGIGFEFAKLLSLDHYNLVLVDIDYEALSDKSANLANQFNNDCIIYVADLSKRKAAFDIYNKISALDIEIDILINNAGFGVFGFFANTAWDREQKMIQLHILTPTLFTKLFLPRMLKRNHGKILNVASMAAFQPGPLMSVYYSTKAYLLSFSHSIANELKGTGVSLTVLCPGLTDTGFRNINGYETPKIRWNMSSPQSVAAYGYKSMQKGKVLAVPGLVNKSFMVIQQFLTRKMASRIIRQLQEKNRSKVKLIID